MVGRGGCLNSARVVVGCGIGQGAGSRDGIREKAEPGTRIQTLWDLRPVFPKGQVFCP